MAVDEHVLLRAAGVIAAELSGRVEQLLRPGNDVGGRVARPPDGDTGGRRGLDAGAKPLRRLRRAAGLGDPRQHDREPAVVEPRNEVELPRRPDEPAEGFVSVPPRDVHEHERERLRVLPRSRREPAELVVEVRLVVDTGERVAAGGVASRRDEQGPAAHEQKRREREDEGDRLRGRFAASTFDDEDDQDHEQRRAHAHGGPQPQRRAALGPARAAPDPA